MRDQQGKATTFKALHEQAQPFLIPNPWDAGTARMLAQLGFEALATTSLGVANLHGRRGVTRDLVLDNIRAISQATSLPLNADLEDGFALPPKEAAKAIALAAEAGAVGGSIEDSINDPVARANHAGVPVLDFNLTVERVQAAVEAARALPFPFMLTARTEGLLYGETDLDPIIKRLQAFEAAGADVLYAPGLKTLDQIRTVTAEISKPFNMVMGVADPDITLTELAAAGVQRVSIGGALSRLALRAFQDGAKEMLAGNFTFLRDMLPIQDLQAAFGDRTE